MKLPNVVNGMQISSSVHDKCPMCLLRKMPQYICRVPETKATKLFKFVYSDLSGPITPVSKEEFWYSISFVDNFSRMIYVYSLRDKSEATKALKRFIADTACYGNIMRMRTDNGTEYISNEFKSLLIENKI